MVLTLVPKTQNTFLPHLFLAQELGHVSFAINWPTFGNAKSGYHNGDLLLSKRRLTRSKSPYSFIHSYLRYDPLAIDIQYANRMSMNHKFIA